MPIRNLLGQIVLLFSVDGMSDIGKIAIFAAVFGFLFVIGRALFWAGQRRDDSFVPSSPPTEPAPLSTRDAGESDKHPGLDVIGSEIPFPVSLPPIVQGPDGTYNRLNINNYFFLKTDLTLGPADRDCLFDELCVEGKDPGNNLPLNYEYKVATLSGLRQAIQRSNLASLYLDALVVIVESWDLRLILQTVIDEIINDYGGGTARSARGSG